MVKRCWERSWERDVREIVKS